MLALALLVFALPAGRRPLWSSDEARFAILAEDVIEHGHWLVAHLRGELYLNKPQLYFWSIAETSRPGGRVTALTAAIPSVVSAVALVGAVAAIGGLLWSTEVGLLAALVLVATPPLYAFSHAVLPDVMMAAFMLWAWYFVLRAQTGAGETRWLLAFYACVAAALLTKGPAGLATLAAVLVATAVTHGPAALARLKPLHGLAVLAVAGTIWPAAYLAAARGRFVSRVVVAHYGPWYLGGHLAPRLGQLATLLASFLPWTIFLAAAALSWPRKADPGRRWIGVATLTLAALLGLSGHQRARYLVPVYPGLALLVAEFIANANADARRRALRAGAWALAAVATLAALVTPLAPGFVAGEDRAFLPESGIALASVIALLLALAASQVIAVRRGALTAGATAAALLIAGVMLVEGATYPAHYTRDNDPRPLAEALARVTPPGARVIAYPDARLSFDFYAQRAVVEAATPEIAAELIQHAPAALLTTRRRWPALAAVLPASARIVASATVGGREFVVAVP